ncbi:ciliary microtubule inner protein 7 isoform X2 [Tamandua tetradactyla]|uniref:ciliary microtubule inner protein 7 isoform X2 n=1 Tax=Tamandua tetradactyla TaxID=48850 RepID=UPI0040543007
MHSMAPFNSCSSGTFDLLSVLGEGQQKRSPLRLSKEHNNGFYGHYRGQFKSESAREYRLAAKPQPPAVFLQRCLEPAQQHFFSKHDNRTSFDKGIGRRKDLERLRQRHTFLHWAPCELELRQQRPLESSYQSDFRSGLGLGSLPQRLVHFVQIQPARASTTYQQNFCQPFQGSHCSSDKLGLEARVTNVLPDLSGTLRPKLLQHYLHAGVSECLNWSRALNKDG